MRETRKITAILAADVVGFSRLAGADEDRTLARLRALRSDLIDPTTAVHNGRVVKRTGDGILVEFRSVVDAVRCAIEMQSDMAQRNVGVAAERRIEFRVGIHLGDVVEESDGDLMGDGVNIAARLESIAAAGAICLSEDAYRQVRARIQLAVTDLGLIKLKNIAEKIRVYSLGVTAPSQLEVTGSKKRYSSLMYASLGAVALVALLGGIWHVVGTYPNSRSAIDPPERSIVVLPLENLSGGAGQDYIVDALSDELTTSISRIPGTFVIARNTAFTYKGRPMDVRTIGSELGVRYALEGSVQPTVSRIRVNAQLIDTKSGAHLWAESFDEDRADLLQMEDDIVTRLARTLDLKLTDVEATRAARLPSINLDAEDLALRCLATYNNNYADAHDPVKHPEVFQLCDQALRLDQGNTRALNLLTYRLLRSTIFGADTTTEFDSLKALVQKALQANPDDADARAAQARLAFIRGNYYEAIADDERVIELEPSRIDAYTGLSDRYFLTGQEDKAIAIVDKAVRLSPRDPGLSYLLLFKAQALSALGRDAEASVLLDQALILAPNDRQILLTQAATLANLDRIGDARQAYTRYAELTGKQMATIAQYKQYLASVTSANIPIMVAWRDHKLAGLRKAGMPEG